MTTKQSEALEAFGLSLEERATLTVKLAADRIAAFCSALMKRYPKDTSIEADGRRGVVRGYRRNTYGEIIAVIVAWEGEKKAEPCAMTLLHRAKAL